MNYREFLFSQLFMKHVESRDTDYKDLEYDLIHAPMMTHFHLYTNSSFAFMQGPEYDSILQYLDDRVVSSDRDRVVALHKRPVWDIMKEYQDTGESYLIEYLQKYAPQYIREPWKY